MVIDTVGAGLSFRKLNRLENGADRNLTVFIRDKCSVVHPGGRHSPLSPRDCRKKGWWMS